jgi:oxygen-independent coproporphyrinogen-3 oxidase
LLDENPSKLKATALGLRYLNNLQEVFLDWVDLLIWLTF